MTQDRGDGQWSGSGALPDFRTSDPDGLPDFDAAQGPVTLGEPSERSRRRTRATMLAVIGGAVVVIAVIALVLSQTVFRSVLDEEDPTAFATGPRSAEGQSEYVPDPQDPDIAPPPPIFTQAPTTECTFPEVVNDPPAADPGTVRGGDLQYTIPDGWGPWVTGALPYLDELGAHGREVEDGWYSVVNLGRVVWPEEEGGYPGLETAAVALFQCYATTSGVVGHFGENPTITDYRSEVMTVDGEPAWIVQATYNFEDPDILDTTSASIVTSIVVETDDGPSGLVSDVAADVPDHAQALEDIIASLDVVE